MNIGIAFWRKTWGYRFFFVNFIKFLLAFLGKWEEISQESKEKILASLRVFSAKKVDFRNRIEIGRILMKMAQELWSDNFEEVDILSNRLVGVLNRLTHEDPLSESNN